MSGLRSTITIMTVEYKVTDISRHNGEIDFDVMKAQGIEGVAIRVTVGDYYTDPMFHINWDRAGAAGLKRTGYQVSNPDSDLRAQIKRFKNAVGARRPDFGNLIGWIGDNELPKLGGEIGRITDTVWYCLNELSNHAGVAAANYTRAEWWNRCVKPAITWGQLFILWIARYGDKLKNPWWPSSPGYLIPHSYKDWGLWQREADGNLKGEQYGVIPEAGAPKPSIDLSRIKDYVFNAVPIPEPEPVPEPTPVPPPTPEPDTYPELVRVTTKLLNVRISPFVTPKWKVGQVKRGTILNQLEEVELDGRTWALVPMYVCKKDKNGKEYLEEV